MTFAVAILPAAIADIAEAARWYESKREGLGLEFAREMNRTIDALAERALLFRVRYRRQNARWVLPRRFPYRICYYLERQTVRVFAVVHAARHDREWKDRLCSPLIGWSERKAPVNRTHSLRFAKSFAGNEGASGSHWIADAQEPPGPNTLGAGATGTETAGRARWNQAATSLKAR